MMIDTSNVRHIGPKLFDHPPDSTAGLRGINCMCRPTDFLLPVQLPLELHVWHEVLIVRYGLPPSILHRKQSHFMAVRSHQLHQFKQIDLGSAEPVVIFVAVQNSHWDDPSLAESPAAGTPRQMTPGSFFD